ncbi:MAG: glycosyltransferase, partial [Bacteroidales bacterium]|nr:glycosyltransferase [Bacteroidales bacterium]
MKITIFDMLTVLVILPVAITCIYYWFLALYALTGRGSSVVCKGEAVNTFAIVIPAHNEEGVIADTLQSCSRIDYPADKFSIYVIADNCTDNTTLIAKEYGVVCYERNDPIKIGKGHALAWAFEHILPQGHDAFLIIDADCSVDTHALRVFDQQLQNGALVLQANDVASNPDASPMSYAVAVGNLIENDLFYAPKSALGLAVFLRGTGMVFHRNILLKYPWKAHSIVEDAEYTINLLRHGIKVRFVQNVKVSSAFPVTQKQLNIQRNRWASGNLSFGKKQAIRLLAEGLFQKKLLLADAGFTFLVLSRPLILVGLFLAIVISYLNWVVQFSMSSMVCGIVAISLFVILSAYFILGIICLGLTWH